MRAKTGAEVFAMPADVTRPSRSEHGGEGRRDIGGVDILVANAGGPPRGHFEELTDDSGWAPSTSR